MNIASLVKASGKPRKQIAQEAAISLPFLSLLESGQRRPGAENLPSLAKALGCHPRDLRPDLAAIFEAANDR